MPQSACMETVTSSQILRPPNSYLLVRDMYVLVISYHNAMKS